MQPNQKPDNYLVWAILSTVLCCLPLGIVAIVKSSKVDSLWAQGYYDEAIQTANDAKKWCIIGAASGVIGSILYIIFVVVLGVFGAMSGGY
ncbi:MAG: CD225/dispanin family protein [Bacteroidales bacterium]|nr:CD225/dispanin family protein [Bacteroidales bacterium]